MLKKNCFSPVQFPVPKHDKYGYCNTLKPPSLVCEGTAKNKWRMPENGSCGKVNLYGQCTGTRENERYDTLMKTHHAGTMDTGFTVLCYKNVNFSEKIF
jgi:hypothetical protein